MCTCSDVQLQGYVTPQARFSHLPLDDVEKYDGRHGFCTAKNYILTQQGHQLFINHSRV